MKDCGIFHARIAYELCRTPFCGENHAFFEFLEKVIDIIKTYNPYKSYSQWIFIAQQTAWDRVRIQFETAIKEGYRQQFIDAFIKMYNEQKKIIRL